jgi:hypothetical protein
LAAPTSLWIGNDDWISRGCPASGIPIGLKLTDATHRISHINEMGG